MTEKGFWTKTEEVFDGLLMGLIKLVILYLAFVGYPEFAAVLVLIYILSELEDIKKILKGI